MKRKSTDIITLIIFIFIIVFGIFLSYQILKIILGGSWEVQDILISLSFLIISSLLGIAGFLIILARAIGRIESNLKNLNNRFHYLAEDFKIHVSKKGH